MARRSKSRRHDVVHSLGGIGHCGAGSERLPGGGPAAGRSCILADAGLFSTPAAGTVTTAFTGSRAAHCRATINVERSHAGGTN